MLEWYIEASDLLQKITDLIKIEHAQRPAQEKSSGQISGLWLLSNKLVNAAEELKACWTKGGRDSDELVVLLRHISPNMQSLKEALDYDLPHIVELAKKHARQGSADDNRLAIAELLHPEVRSHALHHYREGHWREAVLNSVLAITEMIRKRTGLDHDGVPLVTEAFSPKKPLLIFSDNTTESGKNDQIGFMQIILGMYVGIRNPNAHSLEHDLTATTAARYLIFASLVAHKVETAQLAPRQDGAA